MARQSSPQSDWIRAHENRYFADDAPLEALNAAQHVLMARSAARIGRREMAVRMYRVALELWHQMDQTQPGQWEEELVGTNLEFADLLLEHQMGGDRSSTAPYGSA